MKYNNAFGIKLIAWFLILLIMQSSLVFAVGPSLVNVSVSGSAGNPNVARAVDMLAIEAKISPDGVAPEQLQKQLILGPNSARQTFANCQELEDGFVYCYQTQLVDFAQQQSLQSSIGVTLFAFDYEPNIPNQAINTITKNVLIDRIPPTVQINSLRQNGPNATVDFTITDTIATNSALCSGILGAEIYFDGEFIDFVTGSTNCTIRQTYSFEIGDIESKAYSFCLVAYDGAGYSTEQCRSFGVDKSPPIVGQMLLVDSLNRPQTYVSTTGTNLKLRILHTDAERASIRVNNQTRDFVCDRVACETSLGSLAQSTSFVVVGELYDAAGNAAPVSETLQATLDNVRPIATSVTSTVQKNGRAYVTQNSTLTVSFTESDSGFVYSRPTLRVAGVSVIARSCEPSWTCSYQIQVPVQGEYIPIITGFDDAGNQIQMQISSPLYIDTIPPVVSNTAITGLFDGLDKNLIIVGGTIKLDFIVTDNFPVEAIVDFSEVGGGVKIITCLGTCSVTSNQLSTGGLKAPIKITLTDEAGNRDVFQTDPVYVLRDETDSDADHFTHSLHLVPASFERSTSEFVQQRAYAIIKTRPQSSGTVFETKLVSCGNPGSYSAQATTASTQQTASQAIANYQGGGSDISYFQSYKEVQTGTSDEIHIDLTLKAVEIKQDQIVIDCLISVSGVTDTAYVGEELEVARLTFDIFEFSLGTLPENYEKELQDAIDDATKGIMNTLAKFGRFVMWARKLCQLLLAVESISSTLGLFGSKLGTTAVAASSTVVGGVAGEPLGVAAQGSACGAEATSVANKGVMDSVRPICQFINCEINIWDSLSGEGGKGMFGGLFKNKQSDGTPQVAEPIAQSAETPKIDEGDGGSSTGLGNSFQKSFFNKDTILASKTSGNVVVNLVNLCIPGLIINMNEYRQIKCKYVLCLLEDVPNGTPMQACTDAKEYATCVYLFSNIFGILNIVNFWNSIVEAVKQIFISPFALVGLAQGFCAWICGGGHSGTLATIYGFCNTINQLGRIVGLIRNVTSIIEFASNPLPADQDFCKAMDTRLKARDEAQSAQGQSGGETDRGSPGPTGGGTTWS
jgi:hypothetical protein